MKVIQANKFYTLKGGAERYLFELSHWLESQHHQVIVFSMAHPDNEQTPFSDFFVSQIRTQKEEFPEGLRGVWERLRTLGRMTYSLEARRNLATLISSTKPDLCHIHNIYTQISPSILDTLKDQHVPVVMTVHDHHLISPQYNIWAPGCGEDYRDAGIVQATLSRFHKQSFLGSFAQIAVYKFHRSLMMYERGVDVFVCPSSYMKRQLIAGGFPQQKIHVNPYGIDCELIQPRYDHDGYLLFVGRLSEEKGIETIVRAAKLIPDVLFKIVGRGPEMERLHLLADGVKNIEFVGFRMGEELVELYRGARAILAPSRVQENFPLILLEAMALGKPVIASDVGGVSEIVEDRINGLLVGPTDLHGWVEAIMRLVYDEEFRLQLARSARLTVEYKFSLKDHYHRLMKVYEQTKTSFRY